jgi:hypothetical protein
LTHIAGSDVNCSKELRGVRRKNSADNGGGGGVERIGAQSEREEARAVALEVAQIGERVG